MDTHVKRLIKLGYLPISCNEKKIPICKGWTNITKETVEENIKPNCNIGILTGKKSKIIVIDVDVKDKGLETWEKIIKKHGEPTTVKVRTGNGGLHYYFNYNDKLKSDSKVVVYEGEKVGIDIKNDGGYVVCPPSINAEGKKYKWIDKPGTVDLCDIPEWFFQYMKTTHVKKQVIKKKKTKEDTDTDIDINDIMDQVIKDIKNIEDNDKEKKKLKNTENIKQKDTEEDIEEIECANLYDKQHIKKLLQMLSDDRVNSYQSWIEVGMCLFNSEQNSNDYFDLWKEWSKSSDKYKKGVCEEKWVTFKKQKKGLTLGSLHYWAKTDNSTEYAKFKKENCIRCFIEENRDILEINKNEVIEIDNVINTPATYLADLSNTNCLISKNEHNIPENYIQMIKDVGAMIGCRDSNCNGKMLQDKFFKVDDKTMKIIFENSTINITINNTINNYGDKKDDTNIDDDVAIGFLLGDIHKIFDDDAFNTAIITSLSGTHNDIAEVLWHLYKDEFNCTKNKIWYMYDNHRWIKESVDLREKISKELSKKYKEVVQYYKNLIATKTDSESTLIKKKIKEIVSLINGLKKGEQKSKIMGEAEDVFYINNKKFEINLDQNPYLIGFNNGVYDLKKMKFRDGKPEDYITFSVDYNYDDTKKYKGLSKMIEEIMPNENVRKYFLKLIAYCLSGDTHKQKFFTCSGIGANGKSLLFELISKTFGDYFAFVPISLITQKRNGAENATPQLCRTINKRIIVFSEANKGEAINLGILKELSGGDKIVARGLHQNPIEFKPQFKPFILCNHLPQIDANDDYSVWRRMRNIKFTSVFVDKPDKEKPNEYHRDDTLSTNFDKWKVAFMNILIDHYKLFVDEGLDDIKEIIDSTNEYKFAENIYAQFIDEHLQNTEDKKNYIVWTELKNEYDCWYKENYHKIPPNAKEIKKYFEENVFKKTESSYTSEGKRFRGWLNWQLIINNKEKIN